jgi:hypothetical protein
MMLFVFVDVSDVMAGASLVGCDEIILHTVVFPSIGSGSREPFSKLPPLTILDSHSSKNGLFKLIESGCTSFSSRSWLICSNISSLSMSLLSTKARDMTLGCRVPVRYSSAIRSKASRTLRTDRLYRLVS